MEEYYIDAMRVYITVGRLLLVLLVHAVASYRYDAWGNILEQVGPLAEVNPYATPGTGGIRIRGCISCRPGIITLLMEGLSAGTLSSAPKRTLSH